MADNMNLYECFNQNGSVVNCQYKSEDEDHYEEDHFEEDNLYEDIFEEEKEPSEDFERHGLVN